MNIESQVGATIRRLQKRLPQWRTQWARRKPKELATPERLAKRVSYAAAPGVVPTCLDLERILGDNESRSENTKDTNIRIR